MNCPECSTKMESQDASATSKAPGEDVIIAANYYCPECEEYFRWVKGDGLTRVSEHEYSAEQEAHAHILNTLHKAGVGPEY